MLLCALYLLNMFLFGRDYSINICDYRDGQRHDIWLSLHNVKMGRLRLAITVVEGSEKVHTSFQQVTVNKYLGCHEANTSHEITVNCFWK